MQSSKLMHEIPWERCIRIKILFILINFYKASIIAFVYNLNFKILFHVKNPVYSIKTFNLDKVSPFEYGEIFMKSIFSSEMLFVLYVNKTFKVGSID